jgi:hypothetical protein
VNSNGVLFGKGASVNVKGLVASTLDIKDADFNQDNFVFEGAGQGLGQVINQGNLKTAQGGYVALLGDQVINDGVIVAEKGTVSLNGAQKVSLNFNDDSLASVSLNEGSLKALVASNNAIIADGGQIILTTKAANELAESQVNAAGILQAQNLDGLSGKIEVFARGGTAKIDGKLDASAPKGGDGGFIETSGDYVEIAETADITTKAAYGKTGTWLIDPVDFTIAKNGGDLTGAQVGVYLTENNFIVESNKGKKEGNGDINVNDSITWSADTTLTLTADQNIYINAPITASGPNSGLNLNYGGEYYILTPASFSGAEIDSTGRPVAKVDTANGKYGSINFGPSGGQLNINNALYTLIRNLDELKNINDISGKFALANDIDLSGNTFSVSLIATLKSGAVLTGLGHKIIGLTIINSNVDEGSIGTTGIGLIQIAEAQTTVRDLGLTDVSITKADITSSGIGALAGESSGDTLFVYSTGNISSNFSGGLIGILKGYIFSSFSNVLFDGPILTATNKSSYAGGLVAKADGRADESIKIEQSHYIGEIKVTYTSGPTSPFGAGGLVGWLSGNSRGSLLIDKSYVLGTNINGKYLTGVGGLIGYAYLAKNIILTNSFASNVNLEGAKGVGGVAGIIINTPYLIDNCYASGSVTSTELKSFSAASGTGGFIGHLSLGENTSRTGSINNSYANVNVTSTNTASGGFIGYFSSWQSTISNCFATGTVTQTNSKNNTGGFIGSAVGSKDVTIQNSYSTGIVTSNGDNTGGFIGVAYSHIIFINNYFSESSGQSNAIGNPYVDQGGQYNPSTVKVLTLNEAQDIEYYANGTIEEVLAKREADRLDREARAEARSDREAQAAEVARLDSEASTENAQVEVDRIIQEDTVKSATVVTNNQMNGPSSQLTVTAIGYNKSNIDIKTADLSESFSFSLINDQGSNSGSLFTTNIRSVDDGSQSYAVDTKSTSPNGSPNYVGNNENDD